MNHRMVPISENISIPVPLNCTHAEEAAKVAEFLAKNDLTELEAEAIQFGKDLAAGNFFPIEELFKELGIEELEIEKESA